MLRNFFTFSRFTLLVALSISAIAAYYSVIGLTAIFAGAVIPIIVMGTILEIAKITTTVWLHKYWDKAAWSIKTYLTCAVIALAFLTSMGIFGLLSKAHSDTGLVSGDVVAQLNLIDEKIKTQRDNVDMSRKALQQLDEQVNQRLSRSDSEQGAERAVQIRRQQATERNKLLKEINDAQTIIAKLNEERAPIAAKNRKVEAEVGPIKYIAALIYGDNPDTNLLERAVRWVTILIVIVFDPLAIILILAANNSLKWDRNGVIAPAESVVDESVKKIDSISDQATEDVFEEDVTPARRDSSMDFSHMTPWPNVWNDSDEDPEEKIIEDNKPDFSQGKYSTNYNMYPAKINTQYVVTDTQAESTVEEPPPPVDSTPIEQAPEQVPVDTPPVAQVPAQISVEGTKPKVEIITEGVTTQAEIYSSDDAYVIYDGKKMSTAALMQLKPELIVRGPIQNEILFGTKFPPVAKKGDIYTRVDIIPHQTYKFNDNKWIQISRKQNTSYLQNIAYIQYLISRIDSGEYDPELLSTEEQEEIKEYLKRSV